MMKLPFNRRFGFILAGTVLVAGFVWVRTVLPACWCA